MKVNEFMQDNPSRSILPKISRSESMGKNESPFAMPDDAQIFRMKQKQRDRKREEKAEKDRMKVWEKGVKKHGITIKQLNELGKKEMNEQQNQTKMSLIEAAKNAIKNRVKINQPMHDFISKKRQTLLFQMLIDHKREKINQFEDLTRLHRKGLERAEKMLEEDMQAFNSYLNENKREARDAIKKAELQTREKNQKVAIIKEKLEIQADLTGKNMSKRETLQNLRKYKLFLDSLNPDITEDERKKIMDKIEREEQQAQNFGGMNMSENLDDSSEDEDMFFREPSQLMDIFHSLEQSNLSLITHLKQMQQEIELARGSFNSKKDILMKKKKDLQENKQQIHKQINQVDEQIEELKRTTNKDEISLYYASLEEQIVKISKQMGFISVDSKHFTALNLLKNIELNIENQLDYLKELNEKDSSTVNGLCKYVRNQKREKKDQKQEDEIEKRALKEKMDSSTQRQKRRGRPLMARSIIKKEQKKKQVELVQPEEEIQKRKYLM